MLSTAHMELAISSEDVLEFDYPSSVDGAPVRRTLSPWRLEKSANVLFGYDHGREAPRRYMVAKIVHGSATIAAGESFVHPE
jgi:predicted DNA-binding transcriptional regulator YafY